MSDPVGLVFVAAALGFSLLLVVVVVVGVPVVGYLIITRLAREDPDPSTAPVAAAVAAPAVAPQAAAAPPGEAATVTEKTSATKGR